MMVSGVIGMRLRERRMNLRRMRKRRISQPPRRPSWKQARLKRHRGPRRQPPRHLLLSSEF